MSDRAARPEPERRASPTVGSARTRAAAGTRPDEVRRHNRATLLRRLHLRGPCTRAQLATELGLNRSTIKTLVEELAGKHLVMERPPPPRSSAGRPSLLVVPQPNALAVLAVDIGVDQVTVCSVGIGGAVLGSRSRSLARERTRPEEVLTAVAAAQRELSAELHHDVVGAGVSVPGVVRQSDGLVYEAPNLRWRHVPLGELFERALGVPVHVGNDADLGALAEHLRGVAQDYLDVIYLRADIGIGGGIVIDGRPVRGRSASLAELGHLSVRADGSSCYCGSSGCWEAEIGEDALARALGLHEGSSSAEVLVELRSLRLSPETAGDRLLEYTDRLARGLVNLVNVFGSELVVLGGLLAELPAVVVGRVQAAVRDGSMVSRVAGTPVQIVVPNLGADAQVIGAAELAFEVALDR